MQNIKFKKTEEQNMKKLLAIVLSISLIAGLTTATMAAPAKKAVKKAPAKKAVKKVVKPAAKKAAPAPEAPEYQAPAPWVPPAPKAVAPAPAAPVAQAGLGLTAGAKAGLSAGLMGIEGSLSYSLASMIPDTSVRVGGEYLSGTNGSDSVKAVALKVGAAYALTMLKSPDMPVDLYAGGSFILPVKVSVGRKGSYGLEAFVGGKYLVPDLGVLFGEIGYAALKYGGKSAAKGVSASVGYNYSF